MSQKVKIKRTTSSNAMTTSNLTSGELALQENNGLTKLFIGSIGGDSVYQIAGDGYHFKSIPSGPTATNNDDSGNFATTAFVKSSLTKQSVGLSNVDNTSDLNKPISTATQTALDLKQNTITAGTTSQYYRGDKTFQTLDKTAVGLSNVNNTSDLNKPISTATQTALDGKENTITAGTTSQYYRGDKAWATLDKTAVGLSNVTNDSQLTRSSGDFNSFTNKSSPVTSDIILIEDSANSNSKARVILANLPISTATQTALNGKENTITAGTTSQYYRGDKTFQTLDKTAVGLSNVNNTSDLNKPISTATQTALDGKENTITAGTTSQYYRGDKAWATLDSAAVGLGNVTNDSQLKRSSGDFNSFTNKSSPVTSDIILIEDSANSNSKAKTTLANLPISTATQTALNNLIPVGSVQTYYGSTNPTGYLILNGGLYLKSTYQTLWNFAVNNSLTVGPNSTEKGKFIDVDSTTFRVPDLRGYFVRGLGGIDPDSRTMGSIQSDLFKTHTHTHNGTNTANATVGAGGYGFARQSAAGEQKTAAAADTPNSGTEPDILSEIKTLTINSTGGSETRPFNIALNWIIKHG